MKKMKAMCNDLSMRLEIKNCLDSIDIETFRRGIHRSSWLFIELTKMIPRSLQEAHEEAIKFVNVEREIKATTKVLLPRS